MFQIYIVSPLNIVWLVKTIENGEIMLFNKNDIVTMVVLFYPEQGIEMPSEEDNKFAQGLINQAYQLGLSTEFKLSKNAIITVKPMPEKTFPLTRPEEYAKETLESTFPLLRYKLEANGEIAGLTPMKLLIFKVWSVSVGDTIVGIYVMQ